jgi:hypothetical protein
MTDHKTMPANSWPVCLAREERPALADHRRRSSATGDHALLAHRGKPVSGCRDHPPEFSHWRKAMLEDIAITTGGRVIGRRQARKAELHDLGWRARCAFRPGR